MTSANSSVSALVRIQLFRAASSPRTRRYLNALRTFDMSAAEHEALAAIVIVETSQRPSWIRGLEWILVRMGIRLGMPTSLLPRTVGPLQLAGAPMRFDEAVALARQKLDGHVATLDDVAAEWYGSRIAAAGSSTSYAAALRQAAAIWQSMHAS